MEQQYEFRGASTPKFENIQVLRALAAISVVMCHAGQTSVQYTSSTSLFEYPARFLVFGVDLFFVISGFIIYFTSEKSRLSAGEFTKRRLQRIIPLYWLLTIFFFLCLVANPNLKSAAFTDWPKLWASLAFVSFSQWQNPVIYPGWTLEYEMLFYALAALALLVARRAPWAFVSCVLAAASMSHPFLRESSRTVDFLTSSMPLSFIGGILVGEIALKGRAGLFETIAFALAAIVALYYDPLQRALFAGIPSALLVYAAVRKGPSSANPVWVKLGDASYAIYLLHVFLIAVVGKISQRIAPAFNAEMLAVLMTLLSVLAGLGLHQWVELPIAKLWARRPASALAQSV